MRFRVRNVHCSPEQRARKLIDSDDALSTQEQDHVLEYLASSMRSTVTLLHILAAIQIIIALLYTCMLAVGHPLFHAVFDIASDSQDPLATPSALTTAGAVCMIVAAAMLFIGGLYDIRSCRALYIDPAALVEGKVQSGVKGMRRHQIIFFVLSFWPTAYWLWIMHSYHRYLARHLKVEGGVTDHFMELVMVLWQPLLHFTVDRIFLSLAKSREDLVRLAGLRYQYDKL